jgi:xanthine dehydrogenase YagR molybdenum-binding subunit
VTAKNAGPLGRAERNTARLLGGPEIQHYHQAIALVVAETFEQARAAAQLVRVDYVRARGSFDLAAAKDSATKPTGSRPARPIPRWVILPARSPRRRSSSMRPTRRRTSPLDDGAARFDGDLEGGKVTVWTSNQMIDLSRGDLAQDAGHPEGKCPPDLALHRGRLRRQAVRAPTQSSRRSAPARPDEPVKVALPGR